MQAGTMYEWIGGAETVRALVDRFYAIMDTDPAAAGIRAMHQPDLAPMRERLYEYLCGWLGGPPLYVQRQGSPCIAKAHRPFHIDAAAREAWLACMRQAMQDVGIEARYRELLEPAFRRIAQALQNAA